MTDSELIQHIDEILFRRLGKVLEIQSSAQTECGIEILATGIKNLECLGYTMDLFSLLKLRCSPSEDVAEFFIRVQNTVQKAVYGENGLENGKLKYKPMYPDFPKKVMEARSAELYINAMLHYMSDGSFMPSYENPKDNTIDIGADKSKLKVISMGTMEEFRKLMDGLMNAQGSMPQTDTEDLRFYLTNFSDAIDSLPTDSVFKENAIPLCKFLLADCGLEDAVVLNYILKILKAPNDVLRFAVSLSNGDVSLADNCRFKSFTRRERRLLLRLLEQASNLEEDMVRRREVWLRLGERLHPGEYPEFKRVNVAFKKLREKPKAIRTFAGKVENAIEGKHYDEAVALLAKRPGEFARMLDRLLRGTDNPTAVMDAFEAVADKVATRVLMQLREHFLWRNDKSVSEKVETTPVDDSTFDKAKMTHELEEVASSASGLEAAMTSLSQSVVDGTGILGTDETGRSTLKAHRPKVVADGKPIRVFFPKGSIAKAYIVENDLEGISPVVCQRMVSICEDAMVRAYGKREPLGKVWLSPEFRNYIVPFSERSASKALKTIVRGSRLPFADDAKVLRGFVWWKNGIGRTDVDLSALFMDGNWKYIEHVSYSNLRSTKLNACHSGDIVDAPKGAAEYVDVDIQKAKEAGVRYVAFNVYGFTRQNFCDLPECSFGWMELAKVRQGELFNANNVKNRIDIASASDCCLPVIFDLQEQVVIWMDMTLATSLRNCNLENNSVGAIAVCRALAEMHKPNLFDLVSLHVKARGSFVDNKAEADVVFDVDNGITPFDTGVWLSEFV
ncbi:MAG: TerD family protein [Victivallales bacterium]|nr:TerD family protein [Victivallales bacterium]